jgi:hypothetical protein
MSISDRHPAQLIAMVIQIPFGWKGRRSAFDDNLLRGQMEMTCYDAPAAGIVVVRAMVAQWRGGIRQTS